MWHHVLLLSFPCCFMALIREGSEWGEGLARGLGQRTSHAYWWAHRFHISIWWNTSFHEPETRLRKTCPGHTPLFSLQTLVWILESQAQSSFENCSPLCLLEIQGQANRPGCHIESYHPYQIIKVRAGAEGGMFKNICTWKSLSIANTSLLPDF